MSLIEQVPTVPPRRDRRLSTDALGDEIATLAAHLHAATCRWLELIAEFDERGGWGEQGAKSCAHWVSWRCSVAPRAAREHVRVARRLRELPLVHAAFAHGELSFSKVRAVTRVAEVEDEQALLDLARQTTASQLERVVRGYRQVERVERGLADEDRFLSVVHEDDGTVAIRGRLTRDEGAVVLRALEVARDLLRRETARGQTGFGASAADGPAPERLVPDADPVEGAPSAPSAGLADALVHVAETSLQAAGGSVGGVADRFQVVVHVDAATLAGDPAGRSELDDGAPLATATAQRLCCDASLVALVERDGRPLTVGRRTRAVPPSLRRALRSRDRGCRFPGCTQLHHVDAHHVTPWAQGGETKLTNLVQLCRFHHRLVHEGGFRLEREAGGLVVVRPDGRRLRAVPRPPRRGDPGCAVDGNVRRGVVVTERTTMPGWLGEPLDLGAAVDAVLAAAPPSP